MCPMVGRYKMCWAMLSHVRIFCDPMFWAHQAPLSMGFSRQEYWSDLPFLSPGDLPGQGMNPCLLSLPHWQTDSYCWTTQENISVIKIVFSCFNHVQLFCDPMVCSPPGSSVHGISQARILEWIPSAGDLPKPGTETIPSVSSEQQVDSLWLSHLEVSILYDTEGGGRGDQDGEYIYIQGWFMSVYEKNHYNTVK